MSNATAALETPPDWMALAWNELGQHERAGPAANPRIAELYRAAGHPEIKGDEVAWCAAFAGACLERAGHRCSRSLMARSYLAWGVALDQPSYGCITVFSRGDNPSAGHVGFWLAESPEKVLLIGGNQGDAVSVAQFDRSAVLGYRWPVGQQRQASQYTNTSVSGAAAAETHHDTSTLFAIALQHILAVEGGYSDDPYDPGGPTNKGITLQDFASHLNLAVDDQNRVRLIDRLRLISDADVRVIYHQRYWRPSLAAELPPPLAIMHVDAAVNHGLGGAARLLQQAIGADVDGEIGPLTLAAANGMAPALATERYAELRRERYRALPHFWRFGRGWLRRVDRTLALAKLQPARTRETPNLNQGAKPMTELNSRQQETEPAAGTEATGKWWGHSITIWGAIITALCAVLPALGPLIGLEITAQMVKQIGDQSVLAVQSIGGLVGIVMTIYGRSRATTALQRREVRLQL